MKTALFATLPALANDLLPEARKVAGSVPPKLLAALTVELEKGGPEGAIGACRDMAPRMAKAASAPPPARSRPRWKRARSSPKPGRSRSAT